MRSQFEAVDGVARLGSVEDVEAAVERTRSEELRIRQVLHGYSSAEGEGR